MKKKFAILLALFLIAVVCSAGCIDPEDPVDPIDPVDPVDPVDPITPVDPVDPVVPTEEYSVMFMLNYGDAGAYTAETVKAGETVSKPANPTRSGYTFNGWFTAAEGGAAYDFTQPVNADVTLYAQWKKKSSSSSGSSHSHSYSVSVIEPTCGDAGVKTYTCSCGASYTETIPATGQHSLQPYVHTSGGTIFSCLVCGFTTSPVMDEVALIGSQVYDSIAEANSTAKDGETIILLKDCTGDITKDVIINGNDKTATLNYNNVDYINILAANSSGLTITLDGKTVVFEEEADENDYRVVAYTVDGSTYTVYTAYGLKKALTATGTNIVVNLMADLTYEVAAWDNDAMGDASTSTITINGNDHTLTFHQTNSDWNNIATKGAKLIINDAKITNSGHNDGPWNRHDLNFACEVELNNVDSDKALAFKSGATLTGVTINDPNTSDTYAIWIQPNGQTVTIDGLTIDMLACTDGRGIKIDEQYVSSPAKVTLSITDATFKTEEKAAILVKSLAGADITLSNIDITGVAADSENAVWVDEASDAYYDLVTVTGGSKILEGAVSVSTVDELIEILADGGKVKLENDVVITPDKLIDDLAIASFPVGLFIGEDSVLDLNGHEIVISDNGDGTAAAIFAHDADLIISGNGCIKQEGQDDYLLWAKGESIVTITSGELETGSGDSSVLYASGNTAWDPNDSYATINIYGGTFTSGNPSDNQDNANVMNHGVGRINYYGGTYNWDPSALTGDDAPYIKVADGYSVVDNLDGTWTVTA